MTVLTYLVESDEHGGGECEGEEVGQRIPVPELQEHQYSHSTTMEPNMMEKIRRGREREIEIEIEIE